MQVVEDLKDRKVAYLKYLLNFSTNFEFNPVLHEARATLQECDVLSLKTCRKKQRYAYKISQTPTFLFQIWKLKFIL